MPATDIPDSAKTVSPVEHPRLVVRAFPTTDTTFARDVTDAVEAVLAQSPDDGAVTLIEGLLHDRYANVRVHHQSDLARLVEWDDVWYAYRDGRLREPNTHS